jgi:hypothetical protein
VEYVVKEFMERILKKPLEKDVSLAAKTGVTVEFLNILTPNEPKGTYIKNLKNPFQKMDNVKNFNQLAKRDFGLRCIRI